MINEYRKQFREINNMLAKERKDIQRRYKEYDGCHLGYYAQWFFRFFFKIGIAVFAGVVSVVIARYYCW